MEESKRCLLALSGQCWDWKSDTWMGASTCMTHMTPRAMTRRVRGMNPEREENIIPGGVGVQPRTA